jgi:hypothetical protein
VARLSTYKNTPEALPRDYAARASGGSLNFNPSTSKFARQNAFDSSIMDPETTRIFEPFYHTPLPQERYIRLLRINRDIPDSISITLDTFPLDGFLDTKLCHIPGAKQFLKRTKLRTMTLASITQSLSIASHSPSTKTHMTGSMNYVMSFRATFGLTHCASIK